MDKRVVVGIAGSDGKEFKDVQLQPGTRASELLKALNLNGFALAKPEGGMFARADNVYDSVADGQKIYAVKSDVEAGA